MPERARGRERLVALLLVIAAVAVGAWARVHTALADEGFDRRHAEGLLRSDPALVYYFVERIVEGGGLPPEDFRADPRVLYPAKTDVPARFTVGQELLVAWVRLCLGPDPPLHVLCVWVMGLWASLSALGVYLFGRGLGGGPLVAGLCALLHALLPATYRTIGFVLAREDFALPWLALHLGLAALAWRRRDARLALGSGLALGAALVTWHAMRFLVSLEALALLALFVRAGANPLAHRAGLAALAAALAVVLATPVGRATGLWLSPPFVAAAALASAAWLGRGRRIRGLLAALGGGLGALALGLALARLRGGGLVEDSHVLGLVAAKLRHLGRLPADPGALSFEVRLLWQGPFESLRLASLGGEPELVLLGGALLGLVAWTAALLRRPGDPLTFAVVLLALLAVPAAWLVARLAVLPALLWPPLLCALPLGRHARWRSALVALLALSQGLALQGFLARHRIGWYEPPVMRAELAALVERLPALVPEGEAVCADFVTSPAVLAWTRRPIVLQPKYEDRESRERARAFFETFYEGTPEDLRRLVVERFRTRWLLIDRHTLWDLGRYLGGLPRSAGAPREGSAAAALLSQDPAVLRSLPGFELVDRSPPSLRRADGSPSDFYRLYRLAGGN